MINCIYKQIIGGNYESSYRTNKNRRSVRGFSGESVKDEDLKEILVAAQQAPSSVNGEQISLVVIRDKDKIAKIAEIAGG